MRFLSLFTNSIILLLLQQIVSTWFLFDFFMTRDSSTVDKLWRTENSLRNSSIEPINDLAIKVKDRHCTKIVDDQVIFDKIVFIVIDALGSQFIPTIINRDEKPKMPFVERSLKEKKAMGFIAKAATPTVTMPRLKALLSGTIPSFVDVIYNLVSDVSKIEDDNLLRIAKASEKSLVFYGDDTWLSLFDRKMFTRYKETFSFFASDYTTVDTNVTEKAIPETEIINIDWDFLILHYLGLDHIGHVYGTNENQLVKNKLLEMDNVIQIIHGNMLKKSHKTLLVICGDHGMSNEGNHGGDSTLEANTAMIFLPINVNLSDETNNNNRANIQQIDLAVTLSTLTGLAIPRMSKGVLIEPLITSLWSDPKLISCFALENLLQLLNVVDSSKFISSQLGQGISKTLEEHQAEDSNFTYIYGKYFELSRSIQDELLRTVALYSDSVSIIILLSLITLLSLVSIRRVSLQMLFFTLTKFERYSSLIIFIIPILMGGSTDFVEYEKIFWSIYSLIATIVLVLWNIKTSPAVIKELDMFRVVTLIITFMITTFWNSSNGQSHNESNRIYSILSIMILCGSIKKSSETIKFNNVHVLIMGALISACKHFDEPSDEFDHYNSLLYQRLALIMLLIHIAINLSSSFKIPDNQQTSSLTLRKLSTAWIYLACLLSRDHNLIFFISTLIMEASLNSILESLKMPLIPRVLIYLNYAQSSFFNQGNSNLFSSIDIKPAFFGQTQYNLMLAIPLVAIYTYSSQIYWYIKLLQRVQTIKVQVSTGVSNQSKLIEIENDRKNSIDTVTKFVILRNFLSLSYYMYVCMVLKNHLFIWSVISPKLLYHFVGNNVILLACILINILHELNLRFHHNTMGKGLVV